MMRSQTFINHRLLIFVSVCLLIALGLGACSSAANGVGTQAAAAEDTQSPTSTAQPKPTETQVPEATATQVEPTPTATVTNTPTPTVEPTQANFRTLEIDGMEQIFIPKGEFIMGGADKNAQQTFGNGIAYPEVPQFKLFLESFWIDKFEVTNRQYALCVAAGGCQPPKYNAAKNLASYYDNPDYANYPVIYVSWFQAKAYCTWAGRRLVTEAEWEKAARGTDGRLYPWGDDPITSDKANFCSVGCPRSFANPNYDDGYAETAPVGSFPAGASAYGVMDMAGNVWEWTSSLPALYPYVPSDGRESPDANEQRIWRGGAWSTGVWYMRASTRYHSVQRYQYHNLGIRCGASE
jgi:eukaryotic-like serine/threonine-protein kinase